MAKLTTTEDAVVRLLVAGTVVNCRTHTGDEHYFYNRRSIIGLMHRTIIYPRTTEALKRKGITQVNRVIEYSIQYFRVSLAPAGIDYARSKGYIK